MPMLTPIYSSIALIVIFASGCRYLHGTCGDFPDQPPANFTVTYGAGPCFIEEAHSWRILRIEPYYPKPDSIRFRFSIGRGGGPFDSTIVDTTWALSDAEVEEVYHLVIDEGFFCLRDRYDDPKVLDGWCSDCSVTVGGTSKTVGTGNASVGAVNRIAERLHALAGLRFKPDRVDLRIEPG
jgi:hypothetical protein